MQNQEHHQPRVEYSQAIEGIKALQAKIKEINIAIKDLQETMEPRLQLLSTLNVNESEEMSARKERLNDLIKTARENIVSMEKCREMLKEEIGKMEASERSMQKAMDMPPAGHA
jgi:chromosome segregation ATPase